MSTKLLLLRQKILRWYRKNKRNLPWRKTSDPYAILVSEVMLQQTQVRRVLPKYAEFIKAYPTVDALADAPLANVLKIWSGLGYNRRAKYLKQTAEMVKNGYNGQIPNTYEELRKLPGIGDYTANAVLCFAFKEHRPAVDTNVQNIIERELGKNQTLSSSEVRKSVLKLMPKDHPDEFLHALMDYSSLVLSRPKRSGNNSVKFELTNRYLRGKLISILTQKSYNFHDLIHEVQIQTKREKLDIVKALRELQREYLVAKRNGVFSLPS